ncbi:MAG: RluA family pseudouridine synthase [Deltaproteobacteria bacterium]|nr:RluA family pseudouridine synthase [Deltaproteobacteria bacterium]
MSEPERRLVLPDDARGRLDSLLARLLPEVSRRRLKAAFKAGAVRQGGRRAAASDPARPGAEVIVAGLGGTPPAGLELELVGEAEGLLVIEKPAGIPSAPSATGGDPSVAEAMLARYPALEGVGDLPGAPGLCHRLDRETSGLLLFCTDAGLFPGIRAAFERREVEKLYLAVVQGEPPVEGGCELPLGRRKGRARRVEVDLGDEGRELERSWPAQTTFRRLEQRGARALLEVRITTGVTHQIRAHLAHLGFPVVGDPLYGDAGEAPRLGLHAWRLALTHPRTGERLEWESPHPEALRALL